ncbi:MAG: acyltransferase [Desulfobacteraceae bacterium]|nr:acyltransferase [Desulfobacteraceae bacterium]
MLNFFPGPLLGTVTFLLLTVHTIVFFTMMLPFILLKVFIPHAEIRYYMTRVVMFLGTVWIDGNSFIIGITRKIRWDVQGLKGLKIDTSYLVVCNHRSWADILVLQRLFNHNIPFLKFFLKKELMWVPVMGVAWWALDYPFMKRYSKAFVEKHPELRGKDMETTRKYCQKFKRSHVTVLNFLEGTRFNYQKHENQKSPYQHLLLPKAGGIAIVLSSMGEMLSSIIDVTIIYPDNEPHLSFWDFLCGKIHTIVVRVNALPVPKEFIGKDYEQDEMFRENFQQWINRLWEKKDRQIDKTMKQYKSKR